MMNIRFIMEMAKTVSKLVLKVETCLLVLVYSGMGSHFVSGPSLPLYNTGILCVCVSMWWPCGLVVKALDCGSQVHMFQVPPATTGEKISTWHPTHPGPSKTVDWGPGLPWGWTRPLHGCARGGSRNSKGGF